MITTTLHTPLEIFSFFQSLRTLGVELSSFSRISDELKKNEFIREGDDFEPDRLSPESLRQLYLELLKDEVQGEHLRRASPSKDSDHNPRKRKLSTPPLDSITDAVQHTHLLPQLVDKLYARYRDRVVKAIEGEERKFRALQKDIQAIEHGEWDTQLQAQDSSSRGDSKGVSSIQTLLRDDVEDIRDVPSGRDFPDAAGLQHDTPRRPERASQQEVNGYARPTPLGDESVTRGPEVPVTLPQVPSSSVVLSSQSPKHDFQSLSRPTSQSRMDSHGPYLPPINGPVLSPTLDGSRRLPHPPSQIGAPPLASPRLSNSPIILPPPPGMLRSSGSPIGPLDALADLAGQQYRSAPSAQSPRQSQYYSPQPRPNQLPQPRNYMQRSYPYYDSQVPYAQHYPPYGQNPLPPYQSPNQTQYPAHPNSAQAYWSSQRQNSGSQQYPSPLQPYTQYPGYHPGQAGHQQTPQSSHIPSTYPPRLLAQTPNSSSSSERRPNRPFPIDTSLSSTKWKHSHPTGSSLSPGSPTHPGPEAISPISERSPSPILSTAENKDKVVASISRGAKESQRVIPLSEAVLTPVRGKGTTKGARGGRSRRTTPRGGGVRAGSTTSSALPGSARGATRSQSIVSQSDELATENNIGPPHRIKPEPPATPAAAIDDNASASSTPAIEPLRASGRGRRNTFRSLEPASVNRLIGKRKRADTLEDIPDRHTPTPLPPSRPNHVLASRNFPRTSAPIMNDITTHKLASMFAKPLTEREAPGYKNIIYRPQDLKSIKSAISAGSRALVALDDTGSPAVGGSTKGPVSVWVEKAADVVPPKGIVNSAQLEKEVCRIFANAVMYNPDPKRGFGPAFRTRARLAAIVDVDDDGHDDNEAMDEEEYGGGVVRDAREMFETVEKSVGAWRGAERAGEDGRVKLRGGEEAREGSEMDYPPNEEEDGEQEAPERSKRRKLG
ncbi:hypothetical protein MMC19_005189 [Ptychographa xylographoides]|nr:hypothetical protein [Ptychographa xylographoides]